jgi:Na+/melibiose symporter-like transporter
MELSGVKITAGAVATLLSGILVLVLYSHARKGDVTAIVILVVLAVILLILLGVAIAIGTVLVAERIRSHQFQQNAIENQKLLLTQQRAQNELTRGALMLAREQQKLLPGGYSVEDPLALVGVEDAIFDEIYED